jgi:hypothetical protein
VPEASRGRQTFGDMARSLALMTAVIAALLLLGPGRTLVFPGDDRRAPVDYDNVARGFTVRTSTPAVVPVTVPRGWKANAATLTAAADGARLHIGWATPGAKFAGLDESVAPAAPFIRAVLGRRGAAGIGTIDIGAATWDVRRSDRGETALTRTFGSVTVVVTGDAPDLQLRALAAALR